MAKDIYSRLAKDSKSPLKAIYWKLNWYIYLRLALWLYRSKYVHLSLPNMQNYRCKAGLDWDNKKYISGKQVKNKRSTIFCLTFVSIYVFFHNFFHFIFLLKKKGNAPMNQRPYNKQWAYLSPSCFFFSKPRHGPLKNTFRQSLSAPFCLL